LNVIQELWGRAHVFGRAGWNDGKNESFAYTEIDDTVEVGFDVLGALWRRNNDKVGVAFVTNGLSADHASICAAAESASSSVTAPSPTRARPSSRRITTPRCGGAPSSRRPAAHRESGVQL